MCFQRNFWYINVQGVPTTNFGWISNFIFVDEKFVARSQILFQVLYVFLIFFMWRCVIKVFLSFPAFVRSSKWASENYDAQTLYSFTHAVKKATVSYQKRWLKIKCHATACIVGDCLINHRIDYNRETQLKNLMHKNSLSKILSKTRQSRRSSKGQHWTKIITRQWFPCLDKIVSTQQRAPSKNEIYSEHNLITRVFDDPSNFKIAIITFWRQG